MGRLSGLRMPHIRPTIPRPHVERTSPTKKEWGEGAAVRWRGRGEAGRSGEEKRKLCTNYLNFL